MIDLAAVQALGAVRTHGSVVAAASALGFTPSAVSQQLKKLARQTGSPVLERNGRGVVLTDHGMRLAERGTRLLATLEQFEADLAADSDAVGGRVRLAAFSTAVRGLVAPALAAVFREGLPLDVTLLEQEPLDAVDAVAAGQTDLAVVHTWGDTPLAVPDHVHATLVGVDVADVLVPVGHRLAGRSTVTTADLRGEMFASAPPGSVCHQWLGRMFATVGAVPRVSYWAGEFSSHIALVEHGAAVSLIPRLGRELLPAGVQVLQVRDPVPTRQVHLLWRRSVGASPNVRYLARVLTDLAPTVGLGPSPAAPEGHAAV